ncbi:MAG: heme-binding protein [Methanomicrobiales archaeon]|nr:heme-binding protein [Methanomicrobiales archaeon]
MTETMQYLETGQIGEVEIRRYPAVWVATVAGNEEGEVFGILFRYIRGHNQPGKKIPMTAPVITPVEIPMTAPVISDTAGMSFVMPAGFRKEDLPEPRDNRVRLREIPAREVAVIRFRGRASTEDVARVRERLLSALTANGIKTIGEPFLMRYNPPFTPGFLRRNEVGVEIRSE